MLKQIGKYTISERIGRGTYSRIYRAVDSYGRSVAIKVSTTQTEPQHLEEFQKDLVAAASVLHPSLVAVHDLGFEDDFPYLVMELVEGQDLDRILKSNTAPPLADRIQVMQQIGAALKVAHERGVFHLDIRPSKIMVSNEGEAKLLNLGLGRLSFDPARVTEHGYLVGAPFYMSPERLTAIDTADERCDIWSFGVTFYEWLAGRHPFFDDDGERMIGNIMDETPAELADVPAGLNQVILRAMEKDPSDRYRNFAELLTDLQPMITDLKREESDALMAEALKQTDSGRWHEARRIARKLRQLEPEEREPASQLFGFSDDEIENERVAERAPKPAAVQPAAVAATVTVAAAAAAAASALARGSAAAAPVDSARAEVEPAPAGLSSTFQSDTISPRTATAYEKPAVPTPRAPQRPERIPPKIPQLGGAPRNGAPKPENGAAASTRVDSPAPNTTNGARASASAQPPPLAPAKPAVVREVETPKTESTIPRSPQPSKPRQAQAARQSDQTVRILQVDESSGVPWARILAFAVPLVLIIGAGYFFLSSNGKSLHGSSSDAKTVASTKHGTRGDEGDDTAGGPTTNITPTDEHAPANTTAAGANGTPNPGDPNAASSDPANTQPAKAFDAKTLRATKLPGATGRKGSNTVLTGVAAPTLGNGTDTSAIPVAPISLGAPPPPPAPAPKVAAPPPPVSIPTPAPTVAQHPKEAAAPTQVPTGGVFAAPVLIHQVKPIYPPAAMQRKVQGVVRFQATVARDGSLKNIVLLSGDPLLNIAARQAVAQFKYRPATLNGDSIEVTQQIDLKFSLSDR